METKKPDSYSQKNDEFTFQENISSDLICKSNSIEENCNAGNVGQLELKDKSWPEKAKVSQYSQETGGKKQNSKMLLPNKLKRCDQSTVKSEKGQSPKYLANIKMRFIDSKLNHCNFQQIKNMNNKLIDSHPGTLTNDFLYERERMKKKERGKINGSKSVNSMKDSTNFENCFQSVEFFKGPVIQKNYKKKFLKSFLNQVPDKQKSKNFCESQNEEHSKKGKDIKSSELKKILEGRSDLQKQESSEMSTDNWREDPNQKMKVYKQLKQQLYANINYILKSFSNEEAEKKQNLINNIEKLLKQNNSSKLAQRIANKNFLVGLKRNLESKEGKKGNPAINTQEVGEQFSDGERLSPVRKEEIQELKDKMKFLQKNYNQLISRNLRFDENVKTILNINDLNLINKQNSDNLSIHSEIQPKEWNKDMKCECVEARVGLLEKKVLGLIEEPSGQGTLEQQEKEMFDLLEGLYEAKKKLVEAFNVCIEECKVGVKKMHKGIDRGENIGQHAISKFQENIEVVGERFINTVNLKVQKIKEKNSEDEKKMQETEIEMKDIDHKLLSVKTKSMTELETIPEEKEVDELNIQKVQPTVKEKSKGRGKLKTKGKRRTKARTEKSQEDQLLDTDHRRVFAKEKHTKEKTKSRTRIASRKQKLSKELKEIKKASKKVEKGLKKSKAKAKKLEKKKRINKKKEDKYKKSSKLYDINSSIYIGSGLTTRRSVYNRINKLREYTKLVNLEKIKKEEREREKGEKTQPKKDTSDNCEKKIKKRKKKEKKEKKYFDQESLISLPSDYEEEMEDSADDKILDDLDIGMNQQFEEKKSPIQKAREKKMSLKIKRKNSRKRDHLYLEKNEKVQKKPKRRKKRVKVQTK